MSFFERAQQSQKAQQGRRCFVSPCTARKIKENLHHPWNPSSIEMLSEREVNKAKPQLAAITANRPRLSCWHHKEQHPETQIHVLCNQKMRLCLPLEFYVCFFLAFINITQLSHMPLRNRKIHLRG